MTIENGGEIDAGDGSCLVTARGTKDGLIIRMDGRADGSALQQALESFLNNRHSFLQGNEVFLEWVGAKPSPESRDKVANLFKLHGVKVFSSRGVAERGGEQRLEGEFVAHEERVAVGGGAASWDNSDVGGISGRASSGSGLRSHLDSCFEEEGGAGRSLFDGVRSLGLGRGGFYDEEVGSATGGSFDEQLSGDLGGVPSQMSMRSRSSGSSARVSSMARFSQVAGSSQVARSSQIFSVSEFEADSGLQQAGLHKSGVERSGTDRFGAGRLGVGAGDFGFLESVEAYQADAGATSSKNDNLEHGSSKGDSLKAKALASLGRVKVASEPNADSRRDLGADLDPGAQLERAFAEKIMSRNEGFLGSELRSSYGMEGSAWDDADARIEMGTIRSGQRIETEHSLVILGDVNSGGEIVAGGDIIVLGTLRGMAHAGAFEESGGGRVIVAMDLQPTQLRIGNVITRGGADSSQGAATAVGGVRASFGFGSSKSQGAAAKAQQALKAQVGAKGPTSMEVAWVEGATIVVEPYQSRGVGLGRRGVR